MKLRDLFDRRLAALGRHLAQPWAVDPTWLRQVEEAYSETDREALQVLFFDFSSAVSNVEIKDGVGVLSIRGPLMQGALWQDYTDIRNAVDGLMSNAFVNSLLLDIDSPGGDVAGELFGLAERIREARDEKPIYALANDQSTSAAYVLAGSAEKLFVSGSSAIVGGLGVIAMHRDRSGFLKREGVAITEVVSGRHKNDLSPNKPLNADGRATLEGLVESVFVELIDAVSKGRGITEQAIRDQEARIYLGQDAIDRNLADGVATREELVGRLAEQGGASALPAFAATTETQTKGTTEMSTQKEAARTEGMEAERSRATEIRDLCRLAGCPERAGDFIVNGASVEEVRGVLVLDAGAPEGGHRSIDVSAVYSRWNKPYLERQREFPN